MVGRVKQAGAGCTAGAREACCAIASKGGDDARGAVDAAHGMRAHVSDDKVAAPAPQRQARGEGELGSQGWAAIPRQAIGPRASKVRNEASAQVQHTHAA
jgi:hypothetical protein